MKIVITGANGMVARATAKYCAFLGDDVIGLTRADLDISDSSAVSRVIGDIRPDAVINCAAFTDVDGAESNENASYAANAIGVGNLAEASRRTKSSFVTISTDYVFDGSETGFYTQRSAPNPQGVYARSKREGEIKAFAAYPRTMIVRSGWIYGHGGTNFLSVMSKLLETGKPIKAINDSYGTPTSADDLAKRLREFAEADLPGVYHVTNSGEGTSYFGFAEKVCEIAGFERDLLLPTSHTELSRPAPRPVSSKLACLISEKLGFARLRDWEQALADFLTK